MASTQKTALVTGANDGIGFEVAKQLAQRGYFVLLGARGEEKGLAAVEKLTKEIPSARVSFVQIEVTNPQSVSGSVSRVEELLKNHGATKLDLLVNNAGIGRLDAFAKQNAKTVDLSIVRDCFETNFYGTIEVTKAYIPLLNLAEVPTIVFVSTDMASTGRQAKPEAALHVVAYNTSKAALNSYVVALAHELPNFKINAVTPGYTSTKLNSFGQGAKTPAEGAALIVKYGVLDKDGPTCKFFYQDGELPW